MIGECLKKTLRRIGVLESWPNNITVETDIGVAVAYDDFFASDPIFISDSLVPLDKSQVRPVTLFTNYNWPVPQPRRRSILPWLLPTAPRTWPLRHSRSSTPELSRGRGLSLLEGLNSSHIRSRLVPPLLRRNIFLQAVSLAFICLQILVNWFCFIKTRFSISLS